METEKTEKTKHPGLWIKEYLFFKGCTFNSIAKRTGYNVHRVRQVLSGREAVSVKFAESLQEKFEMDADELIRAQHRYNKENNIQTVVKGYRGLPEDFLKDLKKQNDYLKQESKANFPGRVLTNEYINKAEKLFKMVDEVIKFNTMPCKR